MVCVCAFPHTLFTFLFPTPECTDNGQLLWVPRVSWQQLTVVYPWGSFYKTDHRSRRHSPFGDPRFSCAKAKPHLGAAGACLRCPADGAVVLLIVPPWPKIGTKTRKAGGRWDSGQASPRILQGEKLPAKEALRPRPLHLQNSPAQALGNIGREGRRQSRQGRPTQGARSTCSPGPAAEAPRVSSVLLRCHH